MFKRILSFTFVQEALGFFMAAICMAVRKSCRWHIDCPEAVQDIIKTNQPFVLCFWHQHLFLMPQCWQDVTMPMYMLISPHRDGKLIAKTVKWQGIDTIHGSSNDAPTKAIRLLLKQLKAGNCIGITPDGPRGPKHSISAGSIELARLGKVPIVPVALETKGSITLNTWDDFQIPKPFSKAVISWGQPIQATKQTTPDMLQDALLSLQQQARALL